jgi:diacylglycerol kinase (ATP)
MDDNHSSSSAETNKQNGVGLHRVFKASRCSILGFKAAYKYESAFRQELWLAVFLFPVSLFIAQSAVQLALLIGTLILLLLVEVINSAIEAVVDRIGLEHHELSGRAKDLGSAAVFLAILFGVIIWTAIIFDNYLGYP